LQSGTKLLSASSSGNPWCSWIPESTTSVTVWSDNYLPANVEIDCRGGSILEEEVALSRGASIEVHVVGAAEALADRDIDYLLLREVVNGVTQVGAGSLTLDANGRAEIVIPPVSGLLLHLQTVTSHNRAWNFDPPQAGIRQGDVVVFRAHEQVL
jgi:hypothetical protein